jgi:biotin carboxyl carrier protein
MPRLDLEVVRHVLTTAQRFGYREVELQVGDDHFHAKLSPIKRAARPTGGPASAEPESVDVRAITATAVGYYREGDSPLRIGSKVESGDIVAFVIALGIENEVESKWSGTVLEVLVEPDQPVQFGQPLARMKVGE